MQMLKIKKLLGIQIDDFDKGTQILKDFYGISSDIPKIKISNDIILKQMLSIKRKIIRQPKQRNM
ncbi:MAG: hypothetical protein MJ158_00235 [Alphaproteobacteria bacterium]|nr:hypothetical protein [Alphaproteobacteria bacterium]